ncbi:MAG: phosphate acyltransferase PlsX [Acidobacteria bacterium]|nr:phosphate acyltransferase PlsX [Acidobacteriota bacterium]
MSITIAIDAMGGDFAPAHPVTGAVMAARELGVRILLVGRSDAIQTELCKHDISELPIDIQHATEVVSMDESPVTAYRRKKDSSIRIAANCVRDGRAQGTVSAGNTGAVMATAKMVCGVLEGVERPALCAVVPNLKGLSVWLDVGANIDCRPVHLVQFAIMGHLYAREVLGVRNPRVGLMSIGEEDSKGNEVTRETLKILREMPLNFIGNVEGRHVFSGEADVIVCDGFIGNVSLKAVESAADAIFHFMREEIRKSFLARVGYLLARPALRSFRRKIDHAEYGGVPLLGVRGASIISHGGSSPLAIKNAVRVAIDFVQNCVNDRIHDEITKLTSASGLRPPLRGAASAGAGDPS